MISALPVSGAWQPNTTGRPLRAAQDLVEQRQLQLAEALPAQLGPEVGGPQPLAPHLFLQRVDRLTALPFQRHELHVREREVERLDLLADELVHPVELLLVLRIGFEVPRHVQPSLGRDSEYDSDYQERNTNLGAGGRGRPDRPPHPGQTGGPVRHRGPPPARCRRSRSSAAAAPRRGPGWPTSWPRPGSPTRPSTGTSVPRTPWSPPFWRTGASGCRATWRTRWRRSRHPKGQVRRWVAGVLAQADKDIAATTLAVLWNASALGGGPAAGRHFASAPVSSLLHEPFAALGSATPELDAALAAHATLGLLSDCLWRAGAADPRRGRTRRPRSACRAVTP